MESGRIRVLFNLPNSNLHGGPPTHLPLLAEQLKKYVDLEPFEFGRRTDSETVLDKVIGRTRDLFELRRKITNFRPDIIHHNTAFDSIAILRDAPLLWLAKQNRVPVFLKMHGSCDELLGEVNISLRPLRNSIMKNADCIGVLSPIERDRYLEAWPTLLGRVRVIKNIIRPEFHQVTRQEAQRPTVLFISRFLREKGIFELLDCVPLVLRKVPDAQFIFIGSGPDAAEFDSRVAEENLHSAVQRLDHVQHLETLRFYATSWAFVFPTHRAQEGMPMVVAEAMAVGVPVITTKTKFSESYMVANKHCVFVEPDQPASIAKAIIQLLEKRDQRDEMSRNNRELAKTFTSERVTQEFLNIYNSLAASGRWMASNVVPAGM